MITAPVPAGTHHGPLDGRARFTALQVTGVGLIGLYVFVMAAVTVRTSYDVWAGYLFAPLFFCATAPLLKRTLNKVEPDATAHGLILAALGFKLLGGFARYYSNELFLGGGDAQAYHIFGSQIAQEFRHFIFGGPAFQQHIPRFSGTAFMRLITAVIYTVTGSTQLGGYVIFSFLSFWGLYFFYRAYRVAIPDGLHKRYALLVFFLPSMIFWPSSIGKEAWMSFTLGLTCYGAARIITRMRNGYLLMFLGMLGSGMVRPHVTAMIGVGIGAAFILRRSTPGAGGTGRKVMSLLVLAVAAGILFNQMQSFFGLEEGLNVQTVLDETTRRSTQGGSAYEPVRATSPADIPWALVTVLFRPFLFEASGATGLITAAEGTVLLSLFAWNLPRLVRLPATIVKYPYVGLAVVFTIIFVFAFSAVGNFGLLARQRTQLFPIAVIPLTVPLQGMLRTRASMTEGARGAGLSDTASA
jgi:hypothetical protein